MIKKATSCKMSYGATYVRTPYARRTKISRIDGLQLQIDTGTKTRRSYSTILFHGRKQIPIK